jgi:hypothetical protein
MNRQARFVCAAVGLFLIGGCCVVQSRHQRQQADELPRMTCEELVRNGPGANSFIKLTDVRLCTRGHVLDRDMDAALEMYVPIYSARLAREPAPADLGLVLEILDDRDRTRLLAQPAVGELPCEIRPGGNRLEPWVQEKLAAKYPGFPVRNCRVVTVGLHEPTVQKAARTLGFGMVSLLLGGALIVCLLLRPPLLAEHVTPPLPDRAGGRSATPVEACVFHEVQRPDWFTHFLRSFWLVLVLGIPGTALIVGELGDQAPPVVLVLALLILWALLAGSVVLFYRSTQMETQVTADDVVVKVSFRESERVRRAAIAAAHVRPYDPDQEGGGKFVVRGPNDTVCWVAGGRVVELELHDGHRLCIGTQRPSELLAAVRAHVSAEAEPRMEETAEPTSAADGLYASSENIMVRQTGRGWEFLPSPALVHGKCGLFAAVGLSALLVSGFLLWIGGLNPVVAVLAALVALAGAGPALVFTARSWRQGGTVLVVEANGQVRYGTRELCVPGTVQAVRVVREHAEHLDAYRVVLILADGQTVRLPSPFFEEFLKPAHARWFAAVLGRALQVPVVDRA